MANVGADSVKFGAQNVSFGMLVAPNLAPWGPSRDAGGLGSTQKEIFGVQAWISIDFGRPTANHVSLRKLVDFPNGKVIMETKADCSDLEGNAEYVTIINVH